MASAKDIRFDQRNVTNTAYQEKYVNGNSLIIRTDSTGSVVGASTLEGVAIGTISSSTSNFTNVTASVISASVFIGNLSGSLSGSSIITNNLTATNSNLINITSSNISASGYISASGANFNTLNSNSSRLFNVTASNISASGYVSASTVNSTDLVSVNNILTYITSSNISASGNVELGTLAVRGNTTFYGDFTVYGTGSVVNISSSTVIIGDNRIQLNAWSTGSLSQRYAGLDLTDSGSNNNITSSLLWDSANNYWLLTNNQTGSNPVVTSSALILQGPISEFGNEKQLPINTFLKVESAIGNLTASNLTEVDSLLTYNGTISSSAVSASSAFFNLDVLIGGVLKVFNKIYAYAGIIGDITGSLSGSSVIVNTITASTISSSTLISNDNTLVNITSSNISASGYVSGSSANFTNLSSINNILTYVTSSNISASGNITGSNVYVENTITADTGSFIYLNLNNTGSAPTSYTDTGMPGEIRIDNNFIYIYTNNVWVRTPIVRWTT